MYVYFYVLGLEKKDGETYLWTSSSQCVDCYVETTKESLMEVCPYDWEYFKDRHENAGGAN